MLGCGPCAATAAVMSGVDALIAVGKATIGGDKSQWATAAVEASGALGFGVAAKLEKGLKVVEATRVRSVAEFGNNARTTARATNSMRLYQNGIAATEVHDMNLAAYDAGKFLLGFIAPKHPWVQNMP